MTTLKQRIKRTLPSDLRERLKALKRYKADRKNIQRRPAEVFTEIYLTNAWGGNSGEFFSGSEGPSVDQYVDTINNFIEKHNIRRVVDIGCGDYIVGKRIICNDYTGIDVVSVLIDTLNKEFSSVSRRFICADVAELAERPDAELYVIRQVLQHLSNEQIIKILTNLAEVPFLVVTEHYPASQDYVCMNKGKVHGWDTRVSQGSGVYLDAPPFNRQVELLLDCPGEKAHPDIHKRGAIRTFLVKRKTQ